MEEEREGDGAGFFEGGDRWGGVGRGGEGRKGEGEGEGLCMYVYIYTSSAPPLQKKTSTKVGSHLSPEKGGV